jgi:hypothetical protein
MCLKHASYEAVCLERSAYTLRKEIKDALDSDIKDVNFEQDTDADCGHSYWPPTDSCDKGCPACGLEKTEGVRLAAEARAERDADFKNGLYQGHTCGGDFNDMPEELCQGCVTEGKEAERLAAEAQAENEANENAPY